MRDPLGQATLTTWHTVYAFPLREVLPDGAVWQYRYNNRGDVTALIDPAGGETRFTWNDQGDLVTRTDARENTYSYVGDPMAWVDPLGLVGENIFIHYTDLSGMEKY